VTSGRAVAGFSYACALLTAATLGYCLLRIPIQVTDSFLNILTLDRPFGAVVSEALRERGYLRPGLWAGLKVVFDLSGGSYFEWFRGVHVLQVALVLVLFVRLLQPRTRPAAVSVPLAIAALVGSQTFAWTVLEAFPINTFLTIVLCCAAAASLAFAPHRWWVDALAAALFAAAVLTLESGILVWVIFAAGSLVGLKGVSRTGLAVSTLLLLLYLVVRFAVLQAGLPGWLDREAGFGFQRYDGARLQQMFGAAPFVFYGYNVVSAMLNVLTGEPRDGVWQLTRTAAAGEPDPVLLLQAAASTAATLVVGWYAWTRRREWRARRFDRGDQIVLVFAAVLGANAALCYAYTKDVIMSPAGFFHAAAVGVAGAHLVERSATAARGALVRAVLVGAVLSTLWGARLIGIHVALNQMGLEVRDQWAYVDEFLERRNIRTLTPRQEALKRQLQEDALRREPAPAPLRNEWVRAFTR